MTSQRALLYGHAGLTAILAVLCLSANSASFAQEGRKATKIGLVDIGAAFDQYKKKGVLEAEINALKARFQERYRQQRKRIKELNAQSGEASGEALRELEMQIQLELQRSRIMKKQADEQLGEKLNSMTVELLQDIDRAIKSYGKEEGYAFILRIGGPDYSGEDVKNQLFQFQTQTAAYHDPALDLTADIVAGLNKAEAR